MGGILPAPIAADERCSREERASPPVAGSGEAGRDREQGAAGVPDVLVEAVVGAELALERDELLAGVLLEGDEEQSGVEQAGVRIDAVGVGVAAAQDHLPTVRLRRCQPYVGVEGDDRRVVPQRLEIDLVELLVAGERRAAVLE